MIYDTLDHAGQYRKLSGNLAKALDYLTGTELETVEAGRVEIDGERVFALFQSYAKQSRKTTGRGTGSISTSSTLIEGEEAHRRCAARLMERVAEAAPERDIWFYEAKRQSCRSAAAAVCDPLSAGRARAVHRRGRVPAGAEGRCQGRR